MAHISKAKAVGVAAILEHNARTDATRPHSHSNEDIDPNRTKDNYELHEPLREFQRHGKNAYALMKKRLDEVHCMKRDDVTVMSLLCVTLPQNVKPEDERAFFEGVYAWACQEYGAENIVNATVHKDETTPHIHIGFVPVVEGQRRNGEPCLKVRHSALITKTYLETFHQRLSADMGRFLGYEVDILNGATDNGNKTIQKMKEERAERRATAAEERAVAAETRAEQAEERAATAETALVSLLHSVPPLALKPYPPQPTPPEEPDEDSFVARRKYNRAVKKYEKKEIPEYEQKCAEIDTLNAQIRAEWETRYLTVENIEKARNMVEDMRSEVEPTLAAAREREEHAQTLEKRYSDGLVDIERMKSTISDRVEQRAREIVESYAEKVFGADGLSRTERLERFCDNVLMNDGETLEDQTVLSAFEDEERRLKGFFKGR